MLDNLTRVDQKGNDPNSANWRTRTFTYNSLSQLTQAVNPESGTITYTYDNDGNLLTKVAPAPNQTNPAVTVTTTYTYDALHRLLTKDYSDTPASPDASLFYDQTNYNGLTITNGKGRRTGMSDVSGATAWSFDAEGAVKDERRTIGAITKTISYDYNLDGSLKFIVYPSGRRIDYTYDAAARAVSAVDLANAASYATVARYSPAGGLCSAKNGPSITSTFTFNNRFQPNRVHVTTTGAPLNPCDLPAQTANILDFSYSFSQGTSNNSNVVSIANNRTPDRTQSFSYDELNRIKTAQSQATSGQHDWGLSFGYDLWANLLAATVTKGDDVPMLSVGVSTKNQINNTGFVYDAAGNLWQEPGRTYTYNAENQMTAAVGVTYVYDGDGKRVQKSNGKLYWYGTGNDPLAESDLAGTITDEFVFFGGKRVARRKVATGEVNYYFSDHLGSSRAVSSATGAILDDSDFYPFGGERIVTASTDNNYLFTGKERDSESGLDYFGARYDSSSLGRFMSVDPSMQSVVLRNPQSWNRYAYTLNNPLLYIDPNGELWIAAENNTYTWVDKCGEKQTCYESVSVVQGNNLVVYGSTNAKDITTIAANDKGYIDLNEVAQQHDTAFTVKEGAQSFLSLQTASDFFNATQPYKQENPGSDKLVVTDAGKPDGAPFPPHKTHDLGRSVDLRYQDEKGRNLRGNTAGDRADVERTRSLVDAAKAHGFNQNYSARPKEFGTRYAPGHQNHLHLGKIRPPSK